MKGGAISCLDCGVKFASGMKRIFVRDSFGNRVMAAARCRKCDQKVKGYGKGMQSTKVTRLRAELKTVEEAIESWDSLLDTPLPGGVCAGCSGVWSDASYVKIAARRDFLKKQLDKVTANLQKNHPKALMKIEKKAATAKKTIPQAFTAFTAVAEAKEVVAYPLAPQG